MHFSNVLFPDFGHTATSVADAGAQRLSPSRLRDAVDVDIHTGAKVVGACGETIGPIAEVYLDNQTGCSDWAAVSIGRRRCLVPLAEARVSGDTVWVPVTAEQVHSAPHRDPATALTADDKRDLDRHFGGTCLGRPFT